MLFVSYHRICILYIYRYIYIFISSLPLFLLLPFVLLQLSLISVPEWGFLVCLYMLCSYYLLVLLGFHRFSLGISMPCWCMSLDQAFRNVRVCVYLKLYAPYITTLCITLEHFTIYSVNDSNILSYLQYHCSGDRLWFWRFADIVSSSSYVGVWIEKKTNKIDRVRPVVEYMWGFDVNNCVSVFYGICMCINMLRFEDVQILNC